MTYAGSPRCLLHSMSVALDACCTRCLLHSMSVALDVCFASKGGGLCRSSRFQVFFDFFDALTKRVQKVAMLLSVPAMMPRSITGNCH
ncbi:MAG: hypothetical protein CMM05_04890, partial [Rhodopirellula sp.]|nr:hypothetical protein [Rhodopirellula sp.]